MSRAVNTFRPGSTYWYLRDIVPGEARFIPLRDAHAGPNRMRHIQATRQRPKGWEDYKFVCTTVTVVGTVVGDVNFFLKVTRL